MTLDEKLKAVRVELDTQRSKVSTLKTELRGLVEKAESEAELSAAQSKRSALEDLQAEIRANEEKEKLYVSAIEGNTVPAKTRNRNTGNQEQRDAINAYIRSKGEQANGVTFQGKEVVIPGTMLREDTNTSKVTSTNAEPVIPVAVSYNPQRELETVVDLKQFTNVFKATTASGSYPVLKNTKDKLSSPEELQKNPDLAEPDFNDVDWKVKTYRGAIPLSQEAIDDAAVDLINIVNESAQRQKLNTTNGAVADVLKNFTAKTTTTLDDLKKINNVELDAAYQRSLVSSQSYYNWLDTLKDGNGRYLMQDSIISPTGKVFLGMPVFVVNDTILGAEGEGHAFIGDINRAAIFADRSDITVRWVDSNVYGQYLQVATRFDVAKADENAGFFLTQSDSPKR